VRDELQRALAPTQNGSPWMTTVDAALLLGTTAAAIRQRLHSGWMRGNTIKDGKRVLINRQALMAELEQKRGERS
jgi:excisionase family DNA binding protein